MNLKWFKSIALVLAFTVFFAFAGAPYGSMAFAEENISTDEYVMTTEAVESTVQPQAIPIVLGIPVAVELGKWLTAIAVSLIVVNEIAAVKDIYDTLEANRNRTEHKYYSVTYDKSNQWELKTKRALTLQEAIVYVKLGTESNVWTANPVDAQTLARAASSNGKITSAEQHNRNGANTRLYYWHYHDEARKNGHVFFGKNGSPGILNPYRIPSDSLELEEAS